MKRFVFIAALLLSIVACESQNENELNVKYSSEFEFMINEYGTFDREIAPELFAGKRWTVEVEMECNEAGKVLRTVWAPNKKPALSDNTTLTLPPSYNLSKEQNFLRWNYDPNRGMVTIGITDFRILALSEESMVWFYACEDVKGTKRYYQQLLKPHPEKGVDDATQDARTILSSYSGLHDLVAHTGELPYMVKAADRIIAATQTFDPIDAEKLLVACPWHEVMWGAKQEGINGELEWIAEKSYDIMAAWYDVAGHPWGVEEYFSDGYMAPISVGVPPEIETLHRQWRYDPERREIHLSKPNSEGVYEEYFTMPIVGIRPDLLILQNRNGFGDRIYEFYVPRPDLTKR